jgi:PAS domain S-box-containing protein
MSCDFFQKVKDEEGPQFLLLKYAQRVEELLQESEERYRSMFDRIPVGLYQSTPADQFLDVNPAMVQIMGYPDRETLLATNLPDLYVNPEDRGRWQALMEQREVVRDFVVQLCRYDGAVVWVSNTARAVKDEQGQVLHYEGSLEDITERVRAEERLRQYREHLEELVEERTAALKASNAQLQELITEREQAQQAEHEQRVMAEALRDIAALLNSSLDFEDVLENILTHVARVVPYDAGTILMIEDDIVQVTHAQGYDPAILGKQLPLKSMPNLLKIIETGRPSVIDDTHTSPVWIASPETSWIRSSITAAIGADEGVIGFLSLERDTPCAFTSEHVERLQSFANQAAVATRNARLYASVEQARQTAETLRTANLALTQSLDLDAICEKLLDYLNRLVPYDSATIFLLEADTHLTARAVRGYERWVDPSLALSVAFDLEAGSTMHTLVTTQKSFLIPDTSQFPAWVHTPTSGKHIRSWLGVPMLVGGRVIGVCSLDSAQTHTFTQEHIQLAESLAAQAAFAIENAHLFQHARSQAIRNAQLYQETQRRAGEMAALAEVGRDIAATLDLSTVLECIASYARELLAAGTSAVYLLQPDGQTLRPIAAVGDVAEAVMALEIQLGRGIVGNVVQSGVPDQVDDISKDPRAVHAPVIDEEQKGGKLMVAPLLVQERAIGAMTVGRGPQDEVFSQADLNFLVGLGQQAVIAIENARLFAEIQSQKQYSESLVQNSPTAIVSVDIDGNVSSWNPAAEKLFGYTQAEALGRELDALVTTGPEMLEEARGISRQTMSGTSVQSITRRRRQDGTLVDVEILSVPVTVEGQAIAYLAIYHDITELKRAEEELQEAKEAAEAANESKSIFVANVSHELRTPLTSVLGFAKVIKKRLDGKLFPLISAEDRKTQRAIRHTAEEIDIIISEGERLTTLINDVLDLAKIEAGKLEWQMQPLAVSEVIERAIAATSSLFEQKRLKLIKDIEDGLPQVIGDQDRLIQVMINLISNAVKFTDEGSVTCQARQANGEILISVIDTGVSIEEADQSRVFEKFVQVGDTLTDKPRGTGLGLPICKQIVEHHGGRIWVESEPGHGSTFSFTLPFQHGARRRSHTLSGRRSENDPGGG